MFITLIHKYKVEASYEGIQVMYQQVIANQTVVYGVQQKLPSGNEQIKNMNIPVWTELFSNYQ